MVEFRAFSWANCATLIKSSLHSILLYAIVVELVFICVWDELYVLARRFWQSGLKAFIGPKVHLLSTQVHWDMALREAYSISNSMLANRFG